MFIVPYIHNKQSIDTFTVHTIQILCEAGVNLWEEDDSINIMEDILLENELFIHNNTHPVKKLINNNAVYFCKIDTNRTDITNFYKWNEIDIKDNIICWRTIFDIDNAHEKWIETASVSMNNIRLEYILDAIKLLS